MTLSSRCDTINGVINMKNTFIDNLHMMFPFLLSNWSYVEYIEIFIVMKIWPRG